MGLVKNVVCVHTATQVPELFPWNQQLWCLQELSHAATRQTCGTLDAVQP